MDAVNVAAMHRQNELGNWLQFCHSDCSLNVCFSLIWRLTMKRDPGECIGTRVSGKWKELAYQDANKTAFLAILQLSRRREVTVVAVKFRAWVWKRRVTVATALVFVLHHRRPAVRENGDTQGISLFSTKVVKLLSLSRAHGGITPRIIKQLTLFVKCSATPRSN